ncbi:MAG: histidine--tRNA ligase [Elusimicrobia bacterium]|nr:histidine--tRNA ligase [Elusimicrobiota bacterium]
MIIQSVRGTRDILPRLSEQFVRLETISRQQAALWGFGEIRTPTFESLSLFQRGIGDTTDIVEKEMYVFEDRGGRQLALRPEGTASAVRAYIEHHLHHEHKTMRLFYVGSMFRAERPQAGRYREFEQIGFEHFGDPSALADAELIMLAIKILMNFGIKQISLGVNSVGCANCREPFKNQLKESLRVIRDSLCEDCIRRYEKNPLRSLDCKICSSIVREAAPKFILCPECSEHHGRLFQFLNSNKIEFQEDSRLVRGLDYYTRTVYEIAVGGHGAQNAICGGGRYDRLVESLGGPPTPATGFAIGVDRAVEAVAATNSFHERSGPGLLCLVLADVQENTQTYALRLVQELRLKQIAVTHSGPEDSMKSQLRQASKAGANFALIIGEQETMNQTAILKNLITGDQASIGYNDIEKALKQST